MDDPKDTDEQQVEDLELKDEEAENVKGGLQNLTKPPALADSELISQKVQPGVERFGGQVQHNETLVRI